MIKSKRVLALALIAGAISCIGLTPASAQEKKKVLVVFPYLGDQSFVRMHKAAEVEAKRHDDVRVDIVAGPSRTDANYFIDSINKAVIQGYKVVAINHGGAAAQLYPALRKAQEKGVKFVAFDTGLPELEGHSSDVLYDNFAASEAAGKVFASLLPNGGKIGVVRCLLGNPDTDAFVNGFKEAIKGTKLTVVAEGDAKCDPANARTIAENMLTANKDLVGIYDSVDVSAQGSLQALKASKSMAILGSIGGQQYGAEAIDNGSNWKFTIPYPFEEIGKKAVETAVAIAKGETVPSKVSIPAQTPVTKETAGKYLKDLKDRLR